MSDVSGVELEGLRWRIEFEVFQSVRGLEDDSVTRFVRNLDLAFEIRDLRKLHWALNFLRSKENFQLSHDRSSRLDPSALSNLSCWTNAWKELDSERAVVILIRFMMWKMSDDIRTCTCYKRIESVVIIMSRKMDVLFEVKVVKNARKFVWCCQVGVNMNVRVTSDD